MNDTTTLFGLKEDVVDSFKDYVLGFDHQELLEFCQQDEPHDIISEMAGDGVPVYNADILEAAANSPELATEPSELRQDGSPLEIISDNIYCALQAACFEWFSDNKDEIEEECQDIANALEGFKDAIEHQDVDDMIARYKETPVINDLMEALAIEHGGKDERVSVVDDEKTVSEIISDVLGEWYQKQTAKEKV